MRHYVTYRVPKLDLEEDEKFRSKLLGSAHWYHMETVDVENGDTEFEITVSVEERTASFIALRYNCTIRPNHGI